MVKDLTLLTLLLGLLLLLEENRLILLLYLMKLLILLIGGYVLFELAKHQRILKLCEGGSLRLATRQVERVVTCSQLTLTYLLVQLHSLMVL